MALRKSIRHRHGIDMTPMVDLGFLLVIFFMMMTQFRPIDPVQVAIPRSTADTKLPEANIITILVSKEGGIYFTMDRKEKLKSLGEILGTRRSIGLTEDELEKFSNQTSFGIPVSDLKQFLDLSETERNNFPMPGISVETGQNELADWVRYARIANPKARIAIKGDRLAPYPIIKKIMDTLQDLNINTFSLITDTEIKVEK
jgi:biopolymer transport protein ExbD